MERSLSWKIAEVRRRLEEPSYRFIADDRLTMMLQMTGGDTRETVLMALGYILNTINMLIERADNEEKQELSDFFVKYKAMLAMEKREERSSENR